jgi:hypothetical protein
MGILGAADSIYDSSFELVALRLGGS